MAQTLFPASSELFKVVRAIADQRDSSERMSDIAIGRIVGFESARTSRWKHGQIAVADAARLLSLSTALDIDIALLSQVAAGYLTSDEALGVLTDENKLVRFWGNELVLPFDDQEVLLTARNGMQYRIARRAAGQYDRSQQRVDKLNPITEDERTIILADNDETSINVFLNLTGADTGIKGVVSRSGPGTLLLVGWLKPQLVIFDLFIGQIDGFAAVRNLAAHEAARGGIDVVATSLSVSPEIVRDATGCGAIEVVPRPLRARALNRLLNRVRRYR